jgi:pimeloyl-ACP methyl ester carboxylesterase
MAAAEMNWHDALPDFQARTSGIQDLSASPNQPDKPLVVLVHGIGGSAQHWSNPLGLSLDETWLYDTAAAPQAGSGSPALLCSPAYQAGAVQDWCSALASAGISTINFSQSQPSGPLAAAASELVEVLTNVEQLYADSAGPPYVLLCHSRGGLVARQALKQLGRDGLPHLRKVATLCTPHAGSYMPRLSSEYDQALDGQLDFTRLSAQFGLLAGVMQGPLQTCLAAVSGQVRAALMHSFGTTPEGPGFDELVPGSPMLDQLAQGDAPLPGVTYHGYGGSSPGIVSLYLSGAGHTLRLLKVSSPELIGLLDGCIPALQAEYGGLAELDQGDSAVSLASSRWPEAFGASYQVFPINHMQALIDGPLQAAVISLIGLLRQRPDQS